MFPNSSFLSSTSIQPVRRSALRPYCTVRSLTPPTLARVATAGRHLLFSPMWPATISAMNL